MPRTGPATPPPAPSTTDRDLLLGLIGLQLGLIEAGALARAMDDWARDRSRPLAAFLDDRGALDPGDRAALEPLAERHLRRHGGDVARSLETLATASGSTGPARWAEATTKSAGPGSAPGPAPPAPTGGADRFRLLRFHDRGGLGEVFLARDEELRRDVALRRIRPERADDPQSRARFIVEAEITGRLEHPGIVPVYGLGRLADGRPYYAMRLIRGHSLKEAIARFHEDPARDEPGRRSLALRGLLGRFLDVCDAVEYAHSRGVIHRDLKPANVMLGPFGETLVVDWGLAKATGRAAERTTPVPGADATAAPDDPVGALRPATGDDVQPTADGQRLDTLCYAPPEQAAGRLDEVGPRSDVYGLGATLYAILTGRAPFDGPDLPALIRKIERGDRPRPRAVLPGIDRGLEAICLKAMDPRPEGRYADARSLAEDLRRWLADEPVSAWREPPTRRLRRLAGRHRSIVASLGAAGGVAAVALVLASHGAGLRAAARRAEALGRAEALATAEVRAIPQLLRALGDDRSLARARLAELADGLGEGPGRLAAALALLPDEPERADALVARLRRPETTPDALLVIREALHDRGLLAPRAAALRPPADATTLSDADLRGLAALAVVEPDAPAWRRLARPLAEALTAENPLRIGAWREAFGPVARPLLDPLRAIYADRDRPEPRALAFTLLTAFADRPDNPARAEDLAELLVEADPDRAAEIHARLARPIDRAIAASLLAPRLEPVAHRDEARAARQGRIAAAVARLGRPDRAWSLLAGRDDPSARTELTHALAEFGVDPTAPIDRLPEETDPAARRALVLALGGYPLEAIGEEDRGPLIETLRALYRDDPDAGLHSAVGAVLRRWGYADEVEAADRALASREIPTDRGWFLDGQGRSFAAFRGPVEFVMGSPEDEDKRMADEARHTRRIRRSFALATKEVTLAEYARFLDRETDPSVTRVDRIDQVRAYLPSPDCPIVSVSWYDAARFCNWLSALEGIPEGQWCYSRDFGPGRAPHPDSLRRTGYRLPTEAEWEYACRAGSTVVRPHGLAADRLSSYAWTADNAATVLHPVGTKWPNDAGLFDMLGNASEWCQDPYSGPYGPGPDGSLDDDDIPPDRFAEEVRVLRGGSFLSGAPFLRSALRYMDRATFHIGTSGIRPARTLR